MMSNRINSRGAHAFGNFLLAGCVLTEIGCTPTEIKNSERRREKKGRQNEPNETQFSADTLHEPATQASTSSG